MAHFLGISGSGLHSLALLHRTGQGGVYVEIHAAQKPVGPGIIEQQL